MDLLRKLARRFFPREELPLPLKARHVERSLIASADDEVGHPDDRLLDIAIEAIKEARSISLEEVVRRMSAPPYYPDVWPGEHYKILAGFIRLLKPQLVVEVGTFTGLSALTIANSLPADGRLVTFDLIPWHEFRDTVLAKSDFENGKITQELSDLGEPAKFQQHLNLIRSADFIFLDGPKDGVFERRILDNLSSQPLPANPIIMLDDIRVWNMLDIWRKVSRPKLDLTSFGHWSGTGIINWTDS